jgi:hypothetical protein
VCVCVCVCVSPAIMTLPASKSRATWTTIATVVAGFVGLGALASFHEGVAMPAAIGLIAFAALSLLAAIIRK